jgi:hypothetical protein
MCRKNVTKALINMVSGVRFRVSANKWLREENSLPFVFCHLSSVLCIFLTPDTRNLTPVLLKVKIDRINPYFVNYL